MTPPDSFLSAGQAYADGVRGLFVPVSPPAGERSARAGVALADDLAERATGLARASAELTAAAAAGLSDADPEVRDRASAGLLAKALTDLEISACLLQAAEDEEDGLSHRGVLWAERSLFELTAIEENLRLVLGEAPAGAVRAVERGVQRHVGAAPCACPPLPPDLPAARAQLTQAAEDALDLIRDRAAQAGQTAVGGLLGLGMSEVARAAGLVGMDIAQALGVAEKVTRLYELFRQFALSAYESLLALLGPTLAQTVARQVVEWVNDAAQGEQFGQLVEKLYQTRQTGQQLGELIAASQAGLDRFVAAIQGLEGLDARYRQQTGLIEKLLRGLRLLGGVPAAALPQGTLLLAAAYIVLAVYVVLAGADYVDARRLRLLNRTPGVRQVVESHLS